MEDKIDYQIQCIELSKDKGNLILINNFLINLCIENGLLEKSIKEINKLSDLCEEIGIEPINSVIGYGLSKKQIENYYISERREQKLNELLK